MKSTVAFRSLDAAVDFARLLHGEEELGRGLTKQLRRDLDGLAGSLERMVPASSECCFTNASMEAGSAGLPI